MEKYKHPRVYKETFDKVMEFAKKNGRSFIMQLKIIVDKYNERKEK